MRTFGEIETSGRDSGYEMPVVYLDSNSFIYLVEGNDDVASTMRDFFAQLRLRRGLAATSELTLAEVLPKAPTPDHRRGYLDLIVWSGVLELLPVTRDVLIETAAYRQAVSPPNKLMRSLPDAIHAVSAIRSGCRFVVSNDGRFKLPEGMQQFTPKADDIRSLMKHLS